MNVDLATRIAECISYADAAGYLMVAAHLDAALFALRGAGCDVPGDTLLTGRPLH